MKHRLLIPALALLCGAAATPVMANDTLNALSKKALGTIAGTSSTSSSSSSSSSSTLGASLSDSQIATGLKDALRVGTEKAVATVGKPGGFLNDAAVHIPLPGPLAKVKSGLTMVGASGLADDLEQRLNKAAETAAPKAASIFGNAVSKMTIDDARGVLSGPSDSATQYFKRTTTPELLSALKPVIDSSLADVGAVQSYNALTAQAKSLPMASSLNLDLNDYVANKALDGIFYYLAKQEADIRANPAARTTDAIKALFK